MGFFERIIKLFKPKKIEVEESVIYYFGNDEYAKGQALIAQLKKCAERPIGKTTAQICE